MKSFLLSIGELSEITGVHISSLRYYGKLGVLPPAYIDPETNYRYYSYSQVEIVDAIQTCIALDIPLKDYLNFTSNNGQTIRAEELLEYGKAQATRKMQMIRAGIKKIEQYQRQIERSNQLLQSTAPIQYHAGRMVYFVQPMNHALSEEDYKSIDRFPLLAEKQGYRTGAEYGLLYRYTAKTVERYQFVEIISDKVAKDSRLITLPAGDYLSKAVSPEEVEHTEAVFPDLFAQDAERTIIMTGLFQENIDVNDLQYELRCYLK